MRTWKRVEACVSELFVENFAAMHGDIETVLEVLREQRSEIESLKDTLLLMGNDLNRERVKVRSLESQVMELQDRVQAGEKEKENCRADVGRGE